MKLKISPPWNIRYKMLEALFSEDAEVNVTNDRDNISIVVYDNKKKYNALKKILPSTMDEGYTKISVNFLNNKTEDKIRKIDLFKDAFEKNPVVKKIYSLQGPMGNNVDFVEFTATPAQFYADNIGDPKGNKTILIQDIAKEIFEDSGINMYTEEINNFAF